MAQIDSKENSAVAVYAQHSDAENAINLLKKSDSTSRSSQLWAKVITQKIRLSVTTPPVTG
jgi:hypothetical protein